MNNYLNFYLVMSILVMFTGCAGNKKTTEISTTNPFATWGAVPPNLLISFSSGNASTVSSLGSITQTDSAVSGSVLFDSAKNLNTIGFATSSGANISFAASSGAAIVTDSSGSNYLLKDKAGTLVGITPNPYLQSFQYQTYGAWGPAATTGGGGGSTGATNSYAVSMGVITAANAIPALGSAVFSGSAGGYYYVSASQVMPTSAVMTANVDFAARAVNFSTTATNTINVATGAYSSATNLNLTGSMSYSSGINRVSGPVTSASGGLSGNLLGAFYGPAANEIGGTFALNAISSGATFVGGFGGKR